MEGIFGECVRLIYFKISVNRDIKAAIIQLLKPWIKLHYLSGDQLGLKSVYNLKFAV